MKIKIGDYVRTKYGIRKIIDRINDPTNYFDKFWVTDGDIGNSKYITELDIIKEPKKEFIDLIESGDYVNGCCVLKKHYTYMGEHFIGLDTNDSWEWGIGTMPTKYIKSIVTKEQFESMEYKIGE